MHRKGSPEAKGKERNGIDETLLSLFYLICENNIKSDPFVFFVLLWNPQIFPIDAGYCKVCPGFDILFEELQNLDKPCNVLGCNGAGYSSDTNKSTSISFNNIFQHLVHNTSNVLPVILQEDIFVIITILGNQ